MIHVSRAEFARMAKVKREASKARKVKKASNRAYIVAQASASGQELKLAMTNRRSRQDIKEHIVTMLGLVDRWRHGPQCRLGAECPRFKKIGFHFGEVAYHLIPQKRGDAARFLTKNVVWACRGANRGEQMNRDLYRDKHIRLFGKELIESLEAIARTTADFSTADLLEIEREVRQLLQDSVGGSR